MISGRAILYYLVKKKKEENEGPATTHFSLGTMNGKIPFPEEEKQKLISSSLPFEELGWIDDENVTSVHRRSPMPETNVTVTDWLPN